MFSVGESDKQLRASLEKQGVLWSDQLEYSGAGRFAMLQNNMGVVRLYRLPIDAEDYGTLSHEIFHAAEYILREIGMPLSLDSNEAYAYLIGYLTKEIFAHIKP